MLHKVIFDMLQEFPEAVRVCCVISLGDICEIKITHKDKAADLEILLNSLTKFSEPIQQQQKNDAFEILFAKLHL